MLYFNGVVGLVLLGFWVFCIVDVVTTPEGECRNLPKLAWLLIVVLLPQIGSLVWLIAGRPRAGESPRELPYKGNAGRFPEYERPGRHVAVNPEDDEAFLRGLRERAEQQRRKAAEDRRAAEQRRTDEQGRTDDQHDE
jgi:hypothetical protein